MGRCESTLNNVIKSGFVSWLPSPCTFASAASPFPSPSPSGSALRLLPLLAVRLLPASTRGNEPAMQSPSPHPPTQTHQLASPPTFLDPIDLAEIPQRFILEYYTGLLLNYSTQVSIALAGRCGKFGNHHIAFSRHHKRHGDLEHSVWDGRRSRRLLGLAFKPPSFE